MSSGDFDTAIVIGASGFVGRNLIEHLHGKVGQIIGVTNSTPNVALCDLTVNAANLNELPKMSGSTVVINVAAFRYDPERAGLIQSDVLNSNIAISSQVYQFCLQREITEIRQASSMAVYSAESDILNDDIPVDLNSNPFDGELFYGWSKRWWEILSDLYNRKYDINTINFRLSNPYGKYDSINPGKAHVAPAFVMKALDDRPYFEIRGSGSVERDFVAVDDVAGIFVQSLQTKGEHNNYNLCTGKSTTLRELAQTAISLSGMEKEIREGAAGAFGPNKRQSVNSKLQSKFNWTFKSLNEGLEPMLEWYRHAYKPS